MGPWGVILALAVVSAACTVGSGDVATEERDATGFTVVELQSSGRVIIQETGTDSVMIEAEDNILSMLTTDVVNGRLELGSRGSFTSRRDIVYTITVADLEGVTISGSGSVDASGVTSDTFEAEISGSGSLDVSGTAASLVVRISGSGSFDGEDLEAMSGTVSISGSGSALVNVTDALSAVVSGSGSVSYLGSPTVTEEITGSGSVSPG